MAESSWQLASISFGARQFLSTGISQGSVVTCFMCGGMFNYRLTNYDRERMLKIGQHLAKLEARTEWHLFSRTQ